MKKLCLLAVVLFIVVLDDCFGQPRRHLRDYRAKRRSPGFQRGFSSSSAEEFQEKTPEHVIAVKNDADGMLAGDFDGFGVENAANSRSSFLNAEDNGRQASRRSYGSRRRSRYNSNDDYDDNDGYGGNKKTSDYGDSSRSSYSSRNSRDSNYGSQDNYGGKDERYNNDNFDNDNGGYEEKDDYYSQKKSSNYGNKGYSNNRDDSYRDNNQRYSKSTDNYGGRSSGQSRRNNNHGDYESDSYNGHRNRKDQSGYGNRGYGSQRAAGGSYGRQGNYNSRRGSNYGSPTQGLSDVEAAQALYTGNPNAQSQDLDSLMSRKPVYLGQYNEKSPEQGKPRTQIGDYLYGENMVF